MRNSLLLCCSAFSRRAVGATMRALCTAGVAAVLSTSTQAQAQAQALDQGREALFARVEAAAKLGNTPALKYHLGMLLNNGIGTARDLPRAYALFSEAAAAGDALAAYKVGCHLAGQFPGVVSLDEDQALGFKQRAAEAGYDLAQHDVGKILLKRGDLAGGERWLELASRQGDLGSTALLAWTVDKSGKDPVRALGLMLVTQTGMKRTPAELSHRIAALKSRLDADDKQRAEILQASWVTGPTPLTQQARAGIQAVAPLLTQAPPTGLRP